MGGANERSRTWNLGINAHLAARARADTTNKHGVARVPAARKRHRPLINSFYQLSGNLDWHDTNTP